METIPEKKSRSRKRYEPNELRPGPGRPWPHGPESNYTRQSASLPEQGWKNLEKWAKRANARARSGPNYGKPSWRSWLHRFATEEIPRLLKQAEELGFKTKEWQYIRLRIDIDATREALANGRKQEPTDTETESGIQVDPSEGQTSPG